MRSGRAAVVLVCATFLLFAPRAVAQTSTYSTHVIRTSSTAKGHVRASGSWAVWSESDIQWLNDSEYITGPSRVLLYDTRTREIVDIDPGMDNHLDYDVGDGFVVYASAPVLPGPVSIELFEISSSTRSVLASGIDSVGNTCAPVCGTGLVAWTDSLLHVYDVDTALETTYAASSAYHSLAADGESIAWIEPSGDTLASSVHVLNARTGEHRYTTIPEFSPVACSISAAGVLVEGEGPGYRSALYLWSPASSSATKLLGAEDAYHYMSSSRTSGRYIAWSQRSSKEYPNYRVAVMDLSSGESELVYPYVEAGLVGEVDGSRVWFSQAITTQPVTDSYASVGYIDIAPVPERPTDPGSFWSGGGTLSEEAIAETASADASATVPATQAPTLVVDAESTASAAAAVPPVADGSGALWPVLAAAGGLTLVGGGAWLARRKRV